MCRFCDFQKMLLFSFFLFFDAPAFSVYSSWELCEGLQCMSSFWGKLSQNRVFWGRSLPKNCLPTIVLKISNWVLPTTVDTTHKKAAKYTQHFHILPCMDLNKFYHLFHIQANIPYYRYTACSRQEFRFGSWY